MAGDGGGVLGVTGDVDIDAGHVTRGMVSRGGHDSFRCFTPG